VLKSVAHFITESLTNTAVTLGADVIISCDLGIKDIYWYKQKSPDPPESILRTYSNRTEVAKYENSIFEDKYSVKTNSRLFIRNITADELGVYYCVKTSEPQKFSNGTKIYITDSVHRNQTESQQETPWRNLTIITSVLNVLLIVALIGLYCFYYNSCNFLLCAVCFVVFCFLKLLLLSPVSLQLSGFVGDSVLLPCLYQDRELKPEEINVFWRYNDSKNVYDIIKGNPSTDKQDAVFKGRIKNFLSKKGDFSIELSNLMVTDAGQFTCDIPSVEKESRLTLHVKGGMQQKKLAVPDIIMYGLKIINVYFKVYQTATVSLP
uniref:Ig-like domain-containing protein n=1 Tax=Cyprinus carpio TaxID=7962 RepID=A0A8C1XQH9_CYPCA